MPDTVTRQNMTPRSVFIIAGVLGLVFAATLALWAHFGTTVFYEMILAGIAACF